MNSEAAKTKTLDYIKALVTENNNQGKALEFIKIHVNQNVVDLDIATQETFLFIFYITLYVESFMRKNLIAQTLLNNKDIDVFGTLCRKYKEQVNEKRKNKLPETYPKFVILNKIKSLRNDLGHFSERIVTDEDFKFIYHRKFNYEEINKDEKIDLHTERGKLTLLDDTFRFLN